MKEKTKLPNLSDDDVRALAQRVAARMIAEYGDEGAAFLYKSGHMGASFARHTYLELLKALGIDK